MLTAEQVRAARALLRWTVQDLAVAARIGVATIHRLEQTVGPLSGRERTEEDLRRAFELAGIEFVGTPDEPGVILRRRPA
jgi:transcriptional regulator with XRE-family HTH domain